MHANPCGFEVVFRTSAIAIQLTALGLASGVRAANLAGDATATASSVHSPEFAASNAVDGVLSHASRWVSAKAGSPHTLTLVWEAPQRIGALQIASGWESDNGWVSPVRNLRFQSRQDGEWRDIPGARRPGNGNHVLLIVLPEALSTDGLRMVVDDNDHARVVELAVHAPAKQYAPLVLPGSPAGTPARETWTAEDRARSFSGVYPHLAYYNREGECGTGAVVPWADRLWVITYGPHRPLGSSDKLYEIDEELNAVVRPESVGGTPANRMIHRESEQLNIGPYLIDNERTVRVLDPHQMPGRLTGTARHLTDPESKLHIATMEEGLYSVDVHSLEVTEHIRDGNNNAGAAEGGGISSQLPGCHGKGLFSGQGRLVYANNGERGGEATSNPAIPSGSLAIWTGSGDWQMVRRNQFTEVTGPGGIYGNSNPAQDPVWSLGWDYRSVILMLLDGGDWHAFRLPKGSHSYDGAHGWNTEWPRIRDIGEDALLATMHGTFWRFPKTFGAGTTAGIAPRSNYLKVVGDFCRWGDRVVLGCDDSAQKEFLNSRAIKSRHGAPGQSNSNLWFVAPDALDRLGPAIGRGAVWLRDDVEAGILSDPFLFAGYDRRHLHVTHGTGTAIRLRLEVDRGGTGTWEALDGIVVPPNGYHHRGFNREESGAWVRVRVLDSAQTLTVTFAYSNAEPRGTTPDPIFEGLSRRNDAQPLGGLLWSLGNNRRVLGIVPMRPGDDPEPQEYYELDGHMALSPKDSDAMRDRVLKAAPPAGVIREDAASIIITESGRTFRLPRAQPAEGDGPWSAPRLCREVATERDLLNCAGTVYELPARNAGGMAKIRAVASHDLAIHDFCSYRGMLIMTGTAPEPADNPHIVRSEDGRAAVWAGVIDDLWKLGKPRGVGGPWKDSRVTAAVPSDPYLMTGYDRKTIAVSHDADRTVTIGIEVDLDGAGLWVRYRNLPIPPGETVRHVFPDGYSAYWLRTVADAACTTTAQLTYR